MNKLLTITSVIFFVVEAVFLSVFLLDISANMLRTAVPWIIGGSINLAFLFILFFGIFEKEC